MIKRFLADETGATAIEYGLIAALIFVAILLSIVTTGNAVTNLFNFISNKATPVLMNATS